MKKIYRILAILLLAIGLAGTSSAQQAPSVLTNFDFTIVGVGIGVSPDYQHIS